MTYPEQIANKRFSPPSGILLYGPPGTGKTYLAKAAAAEAKVSFYSIDTADILNKWLGEGARRASLTLS